MKNGMQLGRAMVTSAMIAVDDAESIFRRIFSAGGTGGAKGRVKAVTGADGLMRAVMASSAIPFVFPAVEIGGHAHADGYIMANLPVREARALVPGEDALLIGFHVSAPTPQADEELSALELALRLLSLATRAKQEADRELPEVLFQPVDSAFP
jgi:NTE family protein